ncbi:MAG: hypothetical protein HYS23_03210 [Geobacter sp.]|nr:hypothetical protein [Geobacter sp.]
MKIGLILDNPRRDLSATSLIAYQLLKRGWEVYVIPMYDQGYDVPLLGLDVIVPNYARTSNLDFLRSCKEMGLQIYVLDTEGGLMPEDDEGSPEFWAKRFHEIGAYRYVDRHFFWGERMHRAYAALSGLSSEQLHVTGSPRHDMCHPKWRSLLNTHRSGYVLVNMNFPSINPWWGKFEYSKTDGKILFCSALEEISAVANIINVSLQRAMPLQDARMKVLEEYLRILRKICKDNENIQFLIRPHPFENNALYKVAFEEFPNVEVDGTGEVFAAISGARYVIHLNCGTSVETRLLGKIPLSLEFLNSELLKVRISVPSKISYGLVSVDELNSILQGKLNIPDNAFCDSAYLPHIMPWFHGCDGHSAERVAELIDTTALPVKHQKRWFRKSIQSCHDRPRLKQVMVGVVTQFIGSGLYEAVRNRLYSRRAMKYVKPADVAMQLESIRCCDGAATRFSAACAKHPITGLPLSSIKLSADLG